MLNPIGVFWFIFSPLTMIIQIIFPFNIVANSFSLEKSHGCGILVNNFVGFLMQPMKTYLLVITRVNVPVGIMAVPCSWYQGLGGHNKDFIGKCWYWTITHFLIAWAFRPFFPSFTCAQWDCKQFSSTGYRFEI